MVPRPPGVAVRLQPPTAPPPAVPREHPRVRQARQRVRQHHAPGGGLHDPRLLPQHQARPCRARHVRRARLQDLPAPGDAPRVARQPNRHPHGLCHRQRRGHEAVQPADAPDQARQLSRAVSYQPRGAELPRHQVPRRPRVPLRLHPDGRAVLRRRHHAQGARYLAAMDCGQRQRPAPAAAEDRHACRTASEDGRPPRVQHVHVQPHRGRGGGGSNAEAGQGVAQAPGHVRRAAAAAPRARGQDLGSVGQVRQARHLRRAGGKEQAPRHHVLRRGERRAPLGEVHARAATPGRHWRLLHRGDGEGGGHAGGPGTAQEATRANHGAHRPHRGGRQRKGDLHAVQPLRAAGGARSAGGERR
mmetsp:Transcript_33517/g.53766  ORF Transcript_33517/g.53766 Transcript_33517/m.53766 type:complete len:359 (+) Transcript_33517:501-1577(+)